MTQKGVHLIFRSRTPSNPLPPQETSGTVEFETNYDWTAKVKNNKEESFVSLEGATSGSSGTHTLLFIAEKNPDSQKRTNTVSVTAGQVTQEITITQEGQQSTPSLTLSPKPMTFGARAATQPLTVTSNRSWGLDQQSLPDNGWISADPMNGPSGKTTVDISVTERTAQDSRSHSITFEAGDVTKSLTIRQSGAETKGPVTVSYEKGWNLVSIPGDADGATLPSLLPDIDETTINAFKGKYYSPTKYEKGRGYWVEFNSDQTVEFNRKRIKSITLSLREGWNLVGALSDTASVPKSISDPNSIVINNEVWKVVKTSSNSYELKKTEKLIPGKGYFIKASGSGEITISK